MSVRHAIASSLLILSLVGCTVPPAELTEADRTLAATVEIPADKLLLVKQAGDELRRLEGMSDDGEPVAARGVTIGVPQVSTIGTVKQLRELLGSGYQVFVSERQYGIGGSLDHVSVLVSPDPYDMLRTMGTNGWNYDISPEAVVMRLKQWDARFGLEFQGVGFDWLEAELSRPPSDMASFADEVYEFCPDVVDQGTGTVEALAREMKRTRTLYLWWD